MSPALSPSGPPSGSSSGSSSESLSATSSAIASATSSGASGIVLDDDVVALPDGRPRLAVRRATGGGRPFLLVHGLASNARLWDGVARALAAAGHEVVAVDQRGHGRSQEPDDGYDTDTCADDLAALVGTLGFTGDRAPVVAGQSWGGNVVLSLAARHPGVAAAVACVDGGWIRLRDRFASFDECWSVLAPPVFDGMRWDDLERRIRATQAGWPDGGAGTLANLVRTPDGGVRAVLAREHHRQIVRSLYQGDPHAWYLRIDVPVLLVPATGEQPAAGDDGRAAVTRAAVREALALLPDGTARWYPGAHHDVHAERPDEIAADLLALAARVGPAAGSAATGPAGTALLAQPEQERTQQERMQQHVTTQKQPTGAEVEA